MELGASVALHFANTISPYERKIREPIALHFITREVNHMIVAQIASSLAWIPDRAKVLSSQIACKDHFAGEAAGVRLAGRLRRSSLSLNPCMCPTRVLDADDLQKTPPEKVPQEEIAALKAKLATALKEIQDKSSTLTVQELKRLLFRCAAVLISITGVSSILTS